MSTIYELWMDFIGISPQTDMFGFVICSLLGFYMIDRVFVFLYSLFKRS